MISKLKYILLIVGILSISNLLLSQASVYKPFLKKPSWTVEYISWVPWNQTWAYQKDTTISLKVYQKIVEVANAASPLVLREDSALKTIYRYDLTNSLEYIYVDFNLTLGNQWVHGSSTGTVTVKDSVLIGGQYCNHIKIDYGWGSNIDWTEGLLSSFGPNDYFFNNSTCFLMRVNCMCKNNQNYYSIGGLCNLSCGITSVWNYNEIEERISIAPNPSNGIFEVNSPNELNGVIEVYDVTGRLIRKNNSNNKKIDITSAESGIYSVIVKDKNGLQLKTIKIIKD